MAEAPKKSAEEAPATAKSPWPTMLMVMAALAVGGGGTVFYMRGEAKDAAAAAAKGAAPQKLPAQYVKLDPPFVVNFEAKGQMRFLQLAIEVMTRDTETAELIKKNNPMIRNDLIMLFGNQTYTTISSREGKELLRAEALKVVANVIVAEGGDAANVEQLYFTSFVMQ